MKEKTGFFMLVLLAIAILLAACAPAEPPPPTLTPTPEVHPGEALVAERCAACHSLGVIQNASYDQAGWQTTVDRMISHGATLNAEQETQVVDYLAKTYGK